MSEYKECPYCAEQILARAVKCKHCQSTIEKTPDAAGKPGKKAPAAVGETPVLQPQGTQAPAAHPPPPPPAKLQTAPPAPAREKRTSPWKTVAIVFGSLIGVALLGFIALTIYNLLNPTEMAVANVTTASAVTAEGRPLEATDTFYPDAGDIFVALEVENAPSETRLTSTWYYEDADYLIDSFVIELPPGGSKPYFSLFVEEWPDGAYRVDLSVDGKVISTARFRVIMETGKISYTWGQTVLFYDESLPGEYEGQLRSGVPHGQGTWRATANGLEFEYTGQWTEGCAHGYGVFSFSSPALEFYYEGEWSMDNWHGFGTMYVYDAEDNASLSYNGDFENSRWHGYGTMTALFLGEELLFCNVTMREYDQVTLTGNWLDIEEPSGEMTVEYPDGTVLVGYMRYDHDNNYMDYGKEWTVTHPDMTVQVFLVPEGEWELFN